MTFNLGDGVSFRSPGVMADLSGKSDSSPSGDSLPSVLEVGAGGGLAVGLSSAQAARVNIVLLTRADFDGDGRCGGRIGKHGKMCVSYNCKTASHAASSNKMVKEVFARADGSLASEVVCIATHPREELESEATSVFTSPVLDPAQLGDDILSYLTRTRTPEAWRHFFTGLNDNPDATEAQLDKLDDIVDDDNEATFTPFKRQKTGPPSPVDEVDFAELYVPVDTSLPLQHPDRILEHITRHWPQSVANTQNLAGALQAMNNNLQRTKRYIEEISADAQDGIAKLRNDVGRRTSAAGMRSVFELLEELDSRESESVNGDDLASIVLAQVYCELSRELKPVLDFVGRWSPSMNNIGGHLDDAINAVQARVLRVEAGLSAAQARIAAIPTATAATRSGAHSTPAPAPPPMPGLNLGMSSFGVPAAGVRPPPPVGSAPPPPAAPVLGPSPDAFSALAAEIKFVKDSLSELRDDLGSEAVSVGTYDFPSMSALGAFITQEGIPPTGFVCFPDALALLAVAHRSGLNGADEAIDFEVKLKKSGYKTQEEAKVAGSFMLALPAHFGVAPRTGAASRDSRMLPGVPTYGDWDSDNGYVGLTYDLKTDVEAGALSVAEFNAYLAPGASAGLAAAMQTKSLEFVTALSTWISKTYPAIQQKTMASSKEAWNLTAHCVRTVLDLLTKARACGGSYTPDTRLKRMMWGMLQAHKVQQDLLSVGFDAHPAVSHTLHVHLQNNCVTRSVFDKLAKQVGELEKKVKTQRSEIDVLKSKK